MPPDLSRPTTSHAAPRTIVHLFTPASVGGLERVVQALALGQQARGARVHVIAIRPGGDHPNPVVEELRSAGMPVQCVPIPARGYGAERRAVGALLAGVAPDVVHTHGFRADVVDAGVARAAGLPTVTTVHGRTGGSWRVRFYETVQFRCFRRFQAVVAVSRALRDTLVRAGVRAQAVHVVPNAWTGGRIDTRRDDARAVLGVAARGLRAGWVGRLGREKGADVFVEAMARTDARWSASIIGDGPDRAALRARIDTLGLTDRVHLHGALPAAGRLVPAFDAFVLSSRTEGTPIALFEAMAARVPVIATRVGGVPDVVSPSEAAIVDPERPDQIADALSDLAVNPDDGVARARSAWARLETAYAPDPWLDAYDRIYDAVCARAPG